MRHYVLQEWCSLPIGIEEGCIAPSHADALVQAAENSAFARRDRMGVLVQERHKLRAKGIVGVIAAQGCSLEILPKIEGVETAGAVRRRLVHMLGVAHEIPIDLGESAQLQWQNDTLLDVLIRAFCNRLTLALRKGMPRAYLDCEDDLRVLRGNLNVARQFTKHAVNPSRLACRYDALSADIPLNQIMKATVRYLLRFARSKGLQQRLRELTFMYDGIADLPVYALPWGAVQLDRTNETWRALLALAQRLVDRQFQSTTNGAGQGAAILFDMGRLFEEYVGRQCQRSLYGEGFEARLQSGRKFCLQDLETGQALFQTKPDILIRRRKGGEVVHVIDTKWKRLTAQIDDTKRGVSQADVYQMMAYAQLYEAQELTLLYPASAPQFNDVCCLKSLLLPDGKRLHVVTVSLALSPDQIKEGLRRLTVADIFAAPSQ
ncbi:MULTISPECIES: McrC family protein [Pacificibacter]|uniref:McrC family protein n=1 Tax=Pacificibacter TaxID=1042323 RepID=UPI001C0936B6|nr:MULTISPECIES: McrC family protein [Pacificibacter]MBU2934893.1 McrC family protein [Pacificibacter marinus]MDO6617346.1 McrC family protein [Pacificibacter sp. 1_MG-2023]